jgi:predicted NAD/FAD-dependent oxidoreductase
MRAPTEERALRIAVIGAGLSGLAAARMLADQRHRVSLFEKSRGCGGRAATRRAAQPSGETLRFDHGAQYFTARDARFQRCVQTWAKRGLVAPWDGRIGAFDGDGFTPAGQETARWVGVPGMSALGRALAEGLDVRLETRVRPPRWCRGRWQLSDEAGQELGRFERVVVSAPAPQSAELLMDAPRLAAQAACVDYTPCWTLMLGFAAPVPLAFDGVFVHQGALRWVARDSSKPERRVPAGNSPADAVRASSVGPAVEQAAGSTGRGDCWVLHAEPGWTRKHLNDAREEVEAAMLAAFAALVEVAGGALPAITWRQSHSWLYSRVETPLEEGCLWDPALGIGACGDWCNGARVEGAWLSGEALAGRILAAMASG